MHNNGLQYVEEVRWWYNDEGDDLIEQALGKQEFSNDIEEHHYKMLAKYIRKNVCNEFVELFQQYERNYRSIALKNPLNMLIYNYLLDIFNMAYKAIRIYKLPVSELHVLVNIGILSIARLFYKFGNSEYMIEALIRREVKWNIKNYIVKMHEVEIFVPEEDKTDYLDEIVIKVRPHKKRKHKEKRNQYVVNTLKYSESYKTVEGWHPSFIRVHYLNDRGEEEMIQLFFLESR